MPANAKCYPRKTFTLHTSYTRFQPGSSLTHLDQAEFKTDENGFLMRPEADPGISLERRVKGSKGHNDASGDITLAVLEVLGYDVVYGEGSPCATGNATGSTAAGAGST
jgi:hypothetical protein